MQEKLWKVLFLGLVGFNFLNLSSLQAQTLFQNNDASCEDFSTIGGTYNQSATPTLNQPFGDGGITCGPFTDDSALDGDFPDCATVVDPVPNNAPASYVNHSIFTNNGNHGINNCFNAGGTSQFSVDFLRNTNLLISDADVSGSVGSIVNGNLNDNAFNDLALPEVFDATVPMPGIAPRFANYLLSEASGGFGSGTISSNDAFLDPSPPSFNLIPFPVLMGYSSNLPVDRGMLLLNCDNDSVDEAIISVADYDSLSSNKVPGIMMLQNNGAGLVEGDPANDFFSIPSFAETGVNLSAPIAQGDFNADGFIDIAYAKGGSDDGSFLTICFGTGSCGFSCPSTLANSNVVDLEALCPTPGGCRPFPSSAVAGDFDGDGETDIAINETDSVNAVPGVRYFFNNGGDLSTWPNSLVTITDPAGGTGTPTYLDVGEFSDFARQNGIKEVAANTVFTSSPMVAVLATDESGALTPNLLAYAPGDRRIAGSIAVADFDQCGGDDIMALNYGYTSGGDPFQIYQTFNTNTSLFLNTNEPPEVSFDASSETEGSIDQGLTIIANCSDPTSDARTVTWSAVGPSGATITLDPTSSTLIAPEVQATSTFSADEIGDYTITVTCEDFCGEAATDTLVVSLTLNTQGGCLANRLIGDQVDGKWIWGVLFLFPLFFLFRRLGKKAGIVAVILLSVASYSTTTHALTRSFSVNSFQPTIDDSEYFTVYGSPTMLKRNYHVGFYLDYASDVYEFGDANFNRVSGIVDHLLTGNIVGSYGVMDWMSVGMLIPVYFFEGVRAPLLALNQNNFELGDVQLVLKFRLLDREKHGVGISVVPYMIFPSSTNSTAFLGNGSFNGGGKVVIDGRIKDRVSLALNIGYQTASNITDVAGNVLDDQFLASLGVNIEVLKDKLSVIGEGQVATVAKDFFQSRRTTPAEARVGFRYTFAHNHDINAGVGFGISNGIASPQWRGFVGYTYSKRPIVEVTEPQPPITEVQVGDELTLADKIYFEFDKAVIREISKPTLDKIAGFLKAHPEVTKIRIDGFTCDLGSNSYNQRLSERRAQSVARYLEGQGISADRIGTVEGFGEAKPLVPNTDEPHREQNRRVQIFVEAVER